VINRKRYVVLGRFAFAHEALKAPNDVQDSSASAKRAHPDPLRPEQAKELGITGVAKDDNVFLVDKILDERYKNVRGLHVRII
jgi:hypothetical protein